MFCLVPTFSNSIIAILNGVMTHNRLVDILIILMLDGATLI